MPYPKTSRESPRSASDRASKISGSLELATLLEVTAYPKPGNVHRTRDYSETRFEHFLASAVASRPHFEKAAQRGTLISRANISTEDAQVGSIDARPSNRVHSTEKKEGYLYMHPTNSTPRYGIF